MICQKMRERERENINYITSLHEAISFYIRIRL